MTFNTNEFNVLGKYRRLSSLRVVLENTNYRKFFVFYWGVVGGGLLIFLLLPWQQTVTGEGRVIAFSPNERRQEISAPVDGRVKQWKVTEGQKVDKGQIIVELEDNDPDLIDRYRQEKNAAMQKLEAAQHALETAKKNVDRQSELVKKGLSSPLSFENARLNYNKYLTDQANAASEVARADVKISRQVSQSVFSPIDGYILKISAGQGGQLVKQGESLAILVPETNERVVEIWVKGNDMPLLSSGRDVRLQFEGWPAVQFSGWPMVAIGTFGGKLAFVDAADDGTGHFRVIINQSSTEEWPDPRFLRQGVRVRAWVLLSEVRVGYELWRIFNGFPPALRSYEDAKSADTDGSMKFMKTPFQGQESK